MTVTSLAAAGFSPAERGVRPVLSVVDLTTTFGSGDSRFAAVRGVDFELRRGETMMLLGESGSGKSVTSRSIMRLYGRNAEISGSIRLDDTELLTLKPDQMTAVRGARIAMVPQDPHGSLDPLRRIGAQIVEVLALHGVERAKRAGKRRAEELLGLVGIPDPARVANSFPHELSGGMRQRAAIAIAVSCDPQLLIADEPTTALDVTVQAQLREVLAELRERLGMAMLMVTHDVGVAAEAGDRVGVMYAGKIVETGSAAEVLSSPRHPYTAGLLEAQPTPETERGKLRVIKGAPPGAGSPIEGCSFAPRCPFVQPSCLTDDPPLLQIAPGRSVACPVLNPVSEGAADECARAGEDEFCRPHR